MMYWNKNSDGSVSRKPVQDWSDEEKDLHARHEAFLKEANELGYVFSLDCDTLKWVGRFAQRTWVGLTDEDVKWCDHNLHLIRWAEAKLKEKNT